MGDQDRTYRILREKLEILNGDRGDPLLFALRRSEIIAVQEITAGLLRTASQINKNLGLVQAELDNYVTYDALLSRSVEDSALTAPPASPGAGLMWAVPAAATGAWAGHGGGLAVYISAAWVFITPDDGVPFRDKANSANVMKNGAAWSVVSVGGGGGSPNHMKQFDPTARTYSTTWAAGMVWDNFPKSAGSKVLFMASIPMRDSGSFWGGIYTRVEYSVDNGGSWASLGDTGYTSSMVYSGHVIDVWSPNQIIDLPAIVASTQVKFRLFHKTYSGTSRVGGASAFAVTGNFGESQLSLLEILV